MDFVNGATILGRPVAKKAETCANERFPSILSSLLKLGCMLNAVLGAGDEGICEIGLELGIVLALGALLCVAMDKDAATLGSELGASLGVTSGVVIW
eukprot:CAMPEP_0203681448 /NCGR_PEP_ID=MMETSP0090-20130426/42805_1 /ASSEMBLY_ACC=CAM_ASM_001088 /TAXON_ID=426623 /ORGANISM="Chaetoceros affinis, Strain CCMP159" /LENGTH=96 /DNA_ID=CAMNT_0050549935 /DNA_START=156 /DNA_END=443 /DNA_ORIENTATION=-